VGRGQNRLCHLAGVPAGVTLFHRMAVEAHSQVFGGATQRHIDAGPQRLEPAGLTHFGGLAQTDHHHARRAVSEQMGLPRLAGDIAALDCSRDHAVVAGVDGARRSTQLAAGLGEHQQALAFEGLGGSGSRAKFHGISLLCVGSPTLDYPDARPAPSKVYAN